LKSYKVQVRTARHTTCSGARKGVDVELATEPDIDIEKVKDVVAMFGHIDKEDVAFYESLAPFKQLLEKKRQVVERHKQAHLGPQKRRRLEEEN
jgi:hypothetical protein